MRTVQPTTPHARMSKGIAPAATGPAVRVPFLVRTVTTDRATQADLQAFGRLGDLLLAVLAVGVIAAIFAGSF